ncbi:MAG: hypothetical protein HY721_31485 [Planctomycetes bacterium]|nr:hypothetical protein [Planctomycetota bacterium]
MANVSSAAAAPRKPLPRWKKALLGVSALLFISGAGLWTYDRVLGEPEGPARREARNPRAGEDGLSSGLEPGSPLVGEPRTFPRFPGEPGEPDEEEAARGATLRDVSPALMSGGLSFFIGFCIGHAVRAFFRLTALFIGVALIGYFGLAYAGVLPMPDWAALEGHFQSLVAALREKGSAFKAFIESHLPSAGLAAAGMFTGFKKH